MDRGIRESPEFEAANTAGNIGDPGQEEDREREAAISTYKSPSNHWRILELCNCEVGLHGAQMETPAGKLTKAEQQPQQLSSIGKTESGVQVLPSWKGWANNLVFPLRSHGTKNKTEIDQTY